MQTYIAYYRVSTKGQEQSGLGLEAQRKVVESYIKNKGHILEEFTDIESGKNDSRKELQKAISLANQKGATLLIAKLDRLSRNLTFISSLMDSGVKFLCCDLPEANEFTIHIFAALAQQERKMISQRTKAALEVKKKAGIRLGSPQNFTYEHRVKGGSSRTEKAKEVLANKQAAKIIVRLRKERWTLAAIAAELNMDGYRTSMGKLFTPMSVKRLFDRYWLV
ncbi:recombinase family protein [Rhodocytophaga aerolata]|uniref:Recombinase family protein n=1 Tax=Rhodocytophaga aerolata TaxID=455078 RepID=A0ABT8RIT3_9BACT|nr:recombinase family protein [Rhodocytophaga aerolata]MDO1451073.1 recombinase family protein [Rhodocytophaga aerolata]